MVPPSVRVNPLKVLTGLAVILLAVSGVDPALATDAGGQTHSGSSPAQSSNPFAECSDCPEMVIIPPGTFPLGAGGEHKYTEPVTRITLPRPYAISTTEITWDHWAACVTGGSCPDGQSDHGWGQGDLPMINISMIEAQAYTRWLSDRTGQNYRLPTEAEWEYAARAGSENAYWFGDTLEDGTVNCRHCGTPWSGHGSGPVKALPPNPWGLYAMHGNSWEMVSDCWHPTHEAVPTDGSARMVTEAHPDPASCVDRVIKGGSWYYIPKLSRSAARARNDSRIRSYTVGFRVVRDVSEAEYQAGKPQ